MPVTEYAEWPRTLSQLAAAIHEAKATAHQVRVRAIVPAMICIITPTTHPSIIIIVHKAVSYTHLTLPTIYSV